jgi:FtsP/CotA-like multicopper oxidase with cupredoxin domain
MRVPQATSQASSSSSLKPLAFLWACVAASCGGAHHAVAYDGTVLSIDGHRTPISAAEFHYWQLPAPSLWREAFKRIRVAGYDAVAIDLYWGYHSPRPGAYDFTGVRDLDALFDDAAYENLYVIVQSGPYIDNGADASGLPDWMLAHTADRRTLASRYVRESREWFARIDAIVTRHQLTNGTGSIVLDELGDRDDKRVAALERDARADGVSVPFASLSFAEAYEGLRWGWSGDPQGVGGSGPVGATWPRATSKVALPTIGGWRLHSDDDEIYRTFNDQAWPPLLEAGSFDLDDVAGGVTVAGLSTKLKQFFGVDDYGFHHGAVWYRGHFTASGSEHAFSLQGIAGRSGAAAVWLNGQYVGDEVAGSDGFIGVTFPLSPAILRRARDNVIAILFENAGHNEDFNRDSTRAQPRGMLRARLDGSAARIAWRILGNGEYNTDPVRGPLNSGGLAGEIAGWQNPSFSDAPWPAATLPARVRRPGVTWYRAHVKLDLTLPNETLLALQIDGVPGSEYQASVFFNGWLIAHTIGGGQPRVVPIPTDVLANQGANTIAIAAWSLRGHYGLGRVSLTTVRAFNNARQVLPEIAEVRARNGIARVSLAVASANGSLAPHFVYAGSQTPPTIRVRPGDTIEIDLQNRLPRSFSTENAINLHFHGLDVAPVKPGDDVLMTLAGPGGSLHYRVGIPTTQPSGLYWYHPHVHGETYWQVTSGLAGAIIVEGLQNRIPALQTMRERTIVVRDVQNVSNIMAIPWYARKMTSKTYAADPDDAPGPNAACLPEPELHLTLNGLAAPAIRIANGEQQLFRVLNAAASRVLDLAVDNERIGLVAVDGYPVATYPGNRAVVWTTHVIVPPAGRAEFIVTGLAMPTVLRTRCYDSGAAGDRDPEAVLATLRNDGATAIPTPLTLSDAADPSERSAPIPAARPVVERKIALTEDANGFYINGRAFAMGAPPAVVARAGTLEEWTLLNETDEVHDIHIHQVHFLVESIDGKSVFPRVWRDTVLVPVRRHLAGKTAPGIARILVDFRNPSIRGTFVFHCHMLDHEDGGMMAIVKVV